MFEYRSLYFDDPPRGGRVMDIFPSKGSETNPGVFFVHGGGWTGGARESYHVLMNALRNEQFESASTDYQLGKGVLFKQIEDVREGLLLYIRDRVRRSLSPDVFMVGSSAGAHLALTAALASESSEISSHVKGIVVQAPAVTFEPWPDIFPHIWSAMENAVGATYEQQPDLFVKASPIHHLREGQPPILIFHAGNEHMFPLDVAESFQQKARSLGNEVEIKIYPRVEHGFLYSLERWQQKKAFQDLVEFIRSHKVPSSAGK